MRAAEMKPIPICYLITELEVVGGAERTLYNVLLRLDRERFSPEVITLYGGNGPIAQEIRALDIPVTDLGMRRKWRIDALWRLSQLLRRQRPQILHACMFHANIAGRLIGRLAGVPLIITWRHTINLEGRFREALNRWTFPLSDLEFTICDLARAIDLDRAHAAPDKVVTLYNGIEVDAFSPAGTTQPNLRRAFDLPERAMLIGSVGRLHPAKGFEDLLTAMVDIHRNVPQAYLLIVGDGELYDPLQAQVEQLHLTDHVILTGYRADVARILAGLDLFVMASHWEGLPLVVLEAMATGLPVVATAVGGTPEVVVEDVTGLLVPPHDPDALTNAVLRLLRDPGLRQRMGDAGRTRVVEHFTIERMVHKIEGHYEQLLLEKRSL